MNDMEKRLEKARRHNANMKRYYERHPEQAQKNRDRARERQRRLSREKRESGD